MDKIILAVAMLAILALTSLLGGCANNNPVDTDTDYPTLTMTTGDGDGFSVEPPDPKDPNWKLIRDSGKKPVGIFTLELVPFLKDGESGISGDEMIKRAKELDADLGQHYAESLLANQQKIPKEWEKFFLIFPDTIWYDPDFGDHYMPCLDCYDGQWNLGFFWLFNGLGDDAIEWGGDRQRLLRLRPSTRA